MSIGSSQLPLLAEPPEIHDIGIVSVSDDQETVNAAVPVKFMRVVRSAGFTKDGRLTARWETPSSSPSTTMHRCDDSRVPVGRLSPTANGRGSWRRSAVSTPSSDSRPRSPLYAGLWRDPGERRCSADSAAAEESQSQRLCRAVRQVDQRGVSHTRGPARRGASASSRLRVHRTRPSRATPPGTRQPAPATTTTSAKAGRRRSAAGTPRRITQFLQSRGRMRGRPIKRTLRGTWMAFRYMTRHRARYQPQP